MRSLMSSARPWQTSFHCNECEYRGDKGLLSSVLVSEAAGEFSIMADSLTLSTKDGMKKIVVIRSSDVKRRSKNYSSP